MRIIITDSKNGPMAKQLSVLFDGLRHGLVRRIRPLGQQNTSATLSVLEYEILGYFFWTYRSKTFPLYGLRFRLGRSLWPTLPSEPSNKNAGKL